MVRGVRDLLVETVGEFIGELVLTLLVCLLLGGLAFLVLVGWSASPRLAIGGGAVLALVLAHGAWTRFRSPAAGKRRRRPAAVTSACFTAVAGVAVFLFLYATSCGCL